MKRVVEPRDHPRGVTEGRMIGDFFYSLAVNPDFSSVIEAFEEFPTGIRQYRYFGFGSRHGKPSPRHDLA
jgi:hypothetical protein